MTEATNNGASLNINYDAQPFTFTAIEKSCLDRAIATLNAFPPRGMVRHDQDNAQRVSQEVLLIPLILEKYRECVRR